MTITLGSIPINKHVSLRGYHNSPGVPGSEASTLGGRTVVNRLIGNTTDIILECVEQENVRKGYFLNQTLIAIRSYRDAGTTIQLDYHGEVFNVVVKTNGVSVEKALWKSENDDTEKYIGTITLKRV